MSEQQGAENRMSRVKSAFVRGMGAAAILGSSLSGPPAKPIIHEVTPIISGASGSGNTEVVVSEKERLKRQIKEDFGLSVFDPPQSISSSALVDGYRQNRAFYKEMDRIGINRVVGWYLIGWVADKLDIPFSHLSQASSVEDNKFQKIIEPAQERDLRLIHNVLSFLPKHFVDLYRSRTNNALELYIVNDKLPTNPDPFTILESPMKKADDEYRGQCFCLIGTETGRDSILMYQDYFTNEGRREWTGRVLVHEITHAISARVSEERDGELYDPLTQDAFAAMGFKTESLAEKPPEGFVGLFVASDDVEVVYDEEGKKSYRDKKKPGVSSNNMTYVGYGAANLIEFLPVAAMNYLKGREAFVKAYEPIGKDRAQKLYEFVGRELFGGHEFAEGGLEQATSRQ